jgi:hypothetical protein
MVNFLQDWIVSSVLNGFPGIRTQDPWFSSQHTCPWHHLGRQEIIEIFAPKLGKIRFHHSRLDGRSKELSSPKDVGRILRYQLKNTNVFSEMYEI